MTPPSEDPPSAGFSVRRGPGVAEFARLDGVRRRSEIRGPSDPHSASPRATATVDIPSATSAAAAPVQYTSSPVLNVAPEVDVVLQRLFASGLFDRRDIDSRILDLLGSISTQLALAALEDIKRRHFGAIRNKPAFIMSIFKRFIAGGGSIPLLAGPPPGGFPLTSVLASALAHLPPSVSDALQRVFTSGACHPLHFDARAMSALFDLAESDAVRALSDFAAKKPGRLRNPSAFWMCHARKYKDHSRTPGGRIGPLSDPSDYASRFDSSLTYGQSSAGAGDGFTQLDQRSEDLSHSGSLPRIVLDEFALKALRRLPEQDGLAVLAILHDSVARVHNMSAYVTDLCKKFENGKARHL